ncbi:hypothetical protein BKA93DRAFT_785789 [Sparassis latifolia]
MGVSYSFREELYEGAYRAFQEFVPLSQDRKPLTWSTFPYAFAYFIPFLFMGYLVRRANTHLIRLLLLPTVIGLTLRCSYGYKLMNPVYFILDWARTLVALVIISKALDFAFAQNGRFKVGEKRLRGINEPLPKSGPDNEAMHEPTDAFARLPPWLSDALEVSLAVRGIGWDFGQGTYLPQSRRPRERGPFLRATAASLLLNLLYLDLSTSVVESVPGVGSVSGGSIFLPYLPLPLRYTVSTIVHLCAGIMVMSGLEAGDDLLTLLFVGVLGQPPSEWRPIQENPWAAQSLHELWAKRWHQLLRRTFMVFGGFLGQWVAGDLGLVIGVFVASGLYHEVGLQTADSRVTLFFVLQGVGVLCETAWKKLTGRRVGGLAGRVWTYLFVVGLGQMTTDAWCGRGLGGAVLIIPEWMSVFRTFLGPAFAWITQTLLQYNHA